MTKKKNVLLVVVILAVAAVVVLINKRADHHALTKNLTYQTYQTDSGWGYRIFAADTMLIIQQDVIPGIAGVSGFKTDEKAARTANFVISKLKSGVFPPTVSPQDLDSLGVL